MKLIRLLFPATLVLMFVSLMGCSKKENLPVSDNAQLKSFRSEEELRKTLGSLLAKHETVAYSSFDISGEASQQWKVDWRYFIKPNELLNNSIIVQAYSTLNSPDYVKGLSMYTTVNDPRLGKPPYSNIFILRGLGSNKERWAYLMYVDLWNTSQSAQMVDIWDRFSSGYLEDLEHAPAMPKEKDIVTALLNLLEPAP